MAIGDLQGLKENGTGGYDIVTLQASVNELRAGTEDSKVATPKNLKLAELIGIHVGTEPPIDTNILWLDTN